MDPDQTAPSGAVSSGSKLFVLETTNISADDKTMRHFAIMCFKG